MSDTADTVVIGAGIIGAATALALAERGQRVVLVEASDIAAGTTGRSFAWVNASTKTTDEAYHRMNAEGLEAYQNWAARFGADVIGHRTVGALEIAAAGDRAAQGTIEAHAAALAGFGYQVELVEGEALAQLAPHAHFPDGARAMYTPMDAVLDAPRCARALVAGFVAAGGTFLKGADALTLLVDDEGRVEGIETSQGEIAATAVLLATGAETGRTLARLTGFDGFATRFPLREVPGIVLNTPPDPAAPELVLCTATAPEIHLLPAANGGLRIGSDDIDAMAAAGDDPANLRRAGAALLQRASAFVPGLDQRHDPADCEIVIGVRPYPADGLTIAGPMPGAEGLYLVATHSGVTLAPVIARHMAEAIISGTVPQPLARYALDRFPGFA